MHLTGNILRQKRKRRFKEKQIFLQKKFQKTKLYDRVRDRLNERQDKAIKRMFQEGLSGFKGGLSADNYMKITGASPATATRDLADLVDKKALYKTGELRHTRYFLNLKTH